MAKVVYALNQSLDGFVDHMAFAPDRILFRHFIDDVASVAGSFYGRRMYETMRYWDEDHAEWGNAEWEYAKAWRNQHKWVVSGSLKSVGPNATLVARDVGAELRALKDRLEGIIEISGPELAGSMAEHIDEYRLYVHPVVLGSGKPYFHGSAPPLQLLAHEQIGENVVRLIYVPA